MSAALLLSALIILLAAGGWWLRRALPVDATPLVDTLDNLLPQTQCAQCGYAGCRPYAQAMAEGRAASNLCPPGGEALFVQLQSILGDDAAAVPQATHTGVAVIDEADCIGCALCLPACPVDAIVGAHGHMHTVLPGECTGCELCVPACPVDCIRMVDDAPAATPEPVEPAAPADHQGCIRCGACDDACPVNLPAQDLFASLSLQHLDSARTLGVQNCIECGLCDRACPSHIPLVSDFRQAKSAIYQQNQAAIERDRLKQRFSRHSQRIIASEQHSQQQRAARLNKKHQWGSQ